MRAAPGPRLTLTLITVARGVLTSLIAARDMALLATFECSQLFVLRGEVAQTV